MKPAKKPSFAAVGFRAHSQDVSAEQYEVVGACWSKMAGTATTVDRRLECAERAQAAFDKATELRCGRS